MKECPLITVIVACYNVSSYVEKCVKSLLNQDYRDFEIIIINDGSTDDTLAKLSKYKEKLTIINKENGGLSSVRNKGLEVANGKYIIQMDADDYVEPNLISNVSKAISEYNSDLIFYGFDSVNTEGCKLKRGLSKNYKEYTCSGKYLLSLLSKDNIKNMSWGFAFKKEMMVDIYDSIYPVGLFYEDLGSTYKFAERAKTVTFINGVYYHYVQHINTITKTPQIKQYDDLNIIKEKLLSSITDTSQREQWNFHILIMQYQILSRIDNDIARRLKPLIRKHILNNIPKEISKEELIKVFLIKIKLYWKLYPYLLKLRSEL